MGLQYHRICYYCTQSTSVVIDSAPSVADVVRCPRPSTMVGSSLADSVLISVSMDLTTRPNGSRFPQQLTLLVLDVLRTRRFPSSYLHLLEVLIEQPLHTISVFHPRELSWQA